ncbi:MAG: tRNA (N(6)-L-threonylcarbamoyladenosine(37)-C(2))-methylthiotransferase MtaB [Simkaniaceae bacterium]
MKKYKIATLGCRTNQYESSAYTDQLKALGYLEAEQNEEADLCIVNTCTVTGSADKRSFASIKKILKNHPNSRVMVTGCLAEHAQAEIEKISERVEVVPNHDKEKLIERTFPNLENLPEFSIKNFEAHTRAFVKIQDGCNSYCSYCVIPFVRGRSRSKKVDEILKEIEGLVENGYKEIVLTGINIGDFDGGIPENPVRLYELVKLVDEIEGLKRIRISSIDPDEVDEPLLQAVANGKKTCPSMHIVLQSGSNAILNRMRRKYSKQDFFHTIDRLRAVSSDFTFTTDLIVGFPGESERDFEESLEVLNRVQFAKVHLFPYSDRPKTRASRMKNKVPKALIEKRRLKIMDLAQKNAYQLRERFLGLESKVLLENEDSARPGFIRGHTENFLTVSVPQKKLRSNDIVTARLEKNERDGFLGTLI